MDKKYPKTIYSICDFSICPFADKGWFDSFSNFEHLFLQIIYFYKQMKSMEIDNIEEYKQNLYRLLNILADFEDALQHGQRNEEVLDFITEDLGDAYNAFSALEQILKGFRTKKTLQQKTRNFS